MTPYIQDICIDFLDGDVRWRSFAAVSLSKDVPFGGSKNHVLHFHSIFKQSKF